MKTLNLKVVLFFCFFVSIQSFSQKLIAVSNLDGTSEFYQHLDSAIYYAQNNAYISIPGGNFNINNILIDKPLNIIGVGHYPDSSSATGITFLNGNIKVLNNASGGSLSGIYLSGDFIYGTDENNQDVDNYTLQRCNINNLTLSFDGSTSNFNSLNSNISQNIIRGIPNGGDARGIQFRNNLVFAGYFHFYYMTSAEISNNIFVNASYSDKTSGCTITNNIFLVSMYGNSSPSSNSNNIYQNNIYIYGALLEGGNGAIIVSNNVQMATGTVLVNQSGSTFSYNHDYHLQADVNSQIMGLDGTEVGIYGGIYPYKDGAVPVNPHIQYKQIGNSTLSNGLLPVNIKVNAQEN